MTTRHYHVGYNMPGYMPEMDVYTVSSKRAAISAVADEARLLNSDPCDVEAHNGRHGRYVKRGGNGDIWLTRREPCGYGADLHVWYQECQDVTCSTDEDD